MKINIKFSSMHTIIGKPSTITFNLIYDDILYYIFSTDCKKCFEKDNSFEVSSSQLMEISQSFTYSASLFLFKKASVGGSQSTSCIQVLPILYRDSAGV